MTLPKISPSVGAFMGLGAAALVVGAMHFVEGIQTQYWVDACQQMYGPLGDQEQETIRGIVRTFKQLGDGDARKLAYILATVELECSFISKREHETNTNIYKKYWTSGYMGRGLVQLTGYNKYYRFSQLLGVDFVTYPDKAIEMRYALPILVMGMMQGLYSGRKLGDYINAHKTDFYNARRVVNGLDKAGLLANNANNILTHYRR